jgi:thiamine-phosphate pyrophosphorylase
MGLQPLRPLNLIRVMPAKEARSDSVIPRIHLITDDAFPREQMLRLLECGVRQGADAVQVRAKSLSDRELFDLTCEVVERVSGTPAMVIVNDRYDVALSAGADGVHLGLEDLPVAAVRRVVPPAFLVGATCRNIDQAHRAKAGGADYLGLGPLYASTTKTGLPEPVGLAVLRDTARVLPTIAISGITPQRVPEVMANGAHGVAVIAAVSRSPDPQRAAREIVDAVSQA